MKLKPNRRDPVLRMLGLAVDEVERNGEIIQEPGENLSLVKSATQYGKCFNVKAYEVKALLNCHELGKRIRALRKKGIKID